MWFFDDDEEEERADEVPNEAEVFSTARWPFGGTGQPDDVPAPSGTACVQISNALSRSEGDVGEFSFSGAADTLPVLPGLFIDGVGVVPLPLCDDKAKKLIEACKTPFSKENDAVMDRNDGTSWQLQPERVQFQNHKWEEGVKRLSSVAADRLGYKNVKMQCMLQKMVVYGEGGHIAKHRNTEKQDGKLATMVVQLPSAYEGGDLLVYKGKDMQYRHDFGKLDGSAAYLPHYAVHYTDAEHALEKVTSGYRLVLVYSICLVPEMQYLLENNGMSLTEELTDAINRMEDGDDSFALLLSHEYSGIGIGEVGAGSLKGVDRARFQALQEANRSVSPEKKLHFLIAQLTLEIHYSGDGERNETWEERERVETMQWYSTSGRTYTSTDEVTELNFLNPGRESRSDMWKSHGNSSFEGGYDGEPVTKITVYSRSAIIAWPLGRSVANAFKFINKDAALCALQAQSTVDSTTLGEFMDRASTEIENNRGSWAWSRPNVSFGFCQELCKFVIDVGDAALVNTLFRKFLKHLYLGELLELLPYIIRITRKFPWAEIGDAVVGALDKRAEDTDGGEVVSNTNDFELNVLLRFVDGLEPGPAQHQLLKLAVNAASSLIDEVLCSSEYLDMLWQWLFHCGDDEAFTTVVNKFMTADPQLLSPVLTIISEHADDVGISTTDDTFVSLGSIAARRIGWLQGQIKEVARNFSWKMPNALFPSNPKIQAFLRGASETMTTKGIVNFNRITDARKYASRYTRDQSNCHASFTMEASGHGKNAFVTITKTKVWFEKQQAVVSAYQSELDELLERYGKVTGRAGRRMRKKARLE